MKPAQGEFATKVYRVVCDFFGAEDGAAKARRRKTSVAHPGPGALLRLACLGSPEKTIQGELLAYLRMRDLDAVAEVASICSKIRRNTDILVFDSNGNPGAAIEIKHYSANQGAITKLAAGLVEDHSKERPIGVGNRPVPLILVGLYTEVASVSSPLPLTKDGLFRFLRVYFKGTPNRHATEEMRLLFDCWKSKFPRHLLKSFARSGTSFLACDFSRQGRDVKVTGTVASLVILSRS